MSKINLKKNVPKRRLLEIRWGGAENVENQCFAKAKPLFLGSEKLTFCFFVLIFMMPIGA